MRPGFMVSVAASSLLMVLNAQAAQFSIVSGDVHAQGRVSGTSPITDIQDAPADVILAAGQPQGSVSADAKDPAPGGAVGTFTSGAGVSLNIASFSFAGHSTGDGGVVGKPVGTGSGSIDLIFTLDAPTAMHFLGTITPITSLGFTDTGTLSSSGNVVAPLTFDVNGNLDFTQSLNAGSYELQASGSIGPVGSLGGNASESVTATIVPEPVTATMFGLAAVAPFAIRRRLVRRV